MASPQRAPSELVIERATPSDIAELGPIFTTCFADPFMQRIFAPTPAAEQWWRETNAFNLTQRPADHFLVARDPAHGNRAVAYAKWQCPTGDAPSADEFFPRFQSWPPPDGDAELGSRFFDALHRGRLQFFEEKGVTEYLYLDILATLPEYRRRGAGSRLVEWGCRLADEQGKMAYVDASDMGAPLYRAWGFEFLQTIEVPGVEFGCAAYVRYPKTKEEPVSERVSVDLRSS
ncbi:GNAT family [Phlyctema vagabunda]|uniref:GNAT family n=1 Tax=Phlyctema vagabunda TaxID=108571 RepID=A0ABR4PQ38_9HELO